MAPPRLTAALAATAMTGLVVLGAGAFVAGCLALGWVVTRLGVTAGVTGWVVVAALMAIVAGLWWSCYQQALGRRPGVGRGA
jgi:uncharacterized membrane protein YhhN